MIRIASALIAKIAAGMADRLFDEYMRTALLEGAAGVPPRTWTRDTVGGLKKALAYLNIPASSPWAARDSGTYRMLVRSATAALGRSGMFDAAEDLVQSVISGDSLSGTPGGELYAVGRTIADQVERGEGLDNARRLVLRHLKQRSLNVLRGKTRAERSLGNTVQDQVVEDDMMTQLPGVTFYSGHAEDIAFDDFLSGIDADRARMWLEDLWSRTLRPSDWRVVQAWMDDPSKNQTQLARDLGLASGSFIGKAIARARDIAIEEARKNPPPFMQELQMREELAPLGISVRRASTRVRPEDMHVSYPDPRTIRLLVSPYQPGQPWPGSYSGFVEARVGPNQVDDLVRQLQRSGMTVDPMDVEEAIAMA